MTTSTQAMDRGQQRKYRHYYQPTYQDCAGRIQDEYSRKFVRVRLNLIRNMYHGGTVLDFCCGSGDYLVPTAAFAESVIGVDFSAEMIIGALRRVRTMRLANVSFVVANARNVPLESESVSMSFSFSSLYYIANVQEVVRECARILMPNGIAILEFGILHSLNTIVCRSYPELAAPCHIPLSEVYRILAEASFKVEQEISSQLLPLWGSRPRWLRPLLHRYWKTVMQLDVGDKMLDLRVSGSWLLRRFAFRHIMVCRKVT